VEFEYDVDNCGMQQPIPVMPYCPRLANAYVPYQYITDIFMPQEGLDRGTIFPQLFDPYKSKTAYNKQCEEEKVCT
jgi:hypothetical protein